MMRTILAGLCCLSVGIVLGQPEVEAWGNMLGIRIDGQLMEFGSSLRYIAADGTVHATAKERQTPHFGREGKVQWIDTHLDSLYFKESVEEQGEGSARIQVTCTAHADVKAKNTFFSIELPDDLSREGVMSWVDPADLPLGQATPGNGDASFGFPAAGIKVHTPHRQLEIRLEKAVLIGGQIAEKNGHRTTRIDIPLAAGDWEKGQSVKFSVVIKAQGEIYRNPIHLTLNTAVAGRTFDGLGGNFRIQNVALDPEVISYCLEHLRVAWGRVEFPWHFWQPVQNSNPLDSAKAGHLHPAVVRAMDMARTLSKRKIPLILSAWFPPEWAAEGPLHLRPGPDHIWGNPLKKDNMGAIYRSITDYIVFLKQQYKVDVSYFSFNESDLGINVRQTAQEHDELIKGLGAYFASRGLKTKVLLGDNSDATTYSFIDVAKEDSAARPYLSAISFHSWRGWDTATLEKWADAATQLHLPLFVGEGSIDAAAWSYPAFLSEPTYALREISLYARLLAICQPVSILQWQLTTDYSPLAGGGIFHDTTALRPTQRFWNLKQLSMTPKDLSVMPLNCDQPNVAVAALGSNARHLYTLHLVNNGATRQVQLTGLPANVKGLHIYTTNQQASVQEGPLVKVSGGRAVFNLEKQSYVTLISE